MPDEPATAAPSRAARLRLWPAQFHRLGFIAAGLILVWSASQLWEWFGLGEAHSLRLVLCLLFAGLALLVPLARRRMRGAPWRWTLVGVGLLCLAAASTTLDSPVRRRFGENRAVATWNFFHYYLGSKYFAELGFDGLYEEMVKADFEGPRYFREATRIRDLHTYQAVSAEPFRKAPRRESWTEARWSEFKRDVAALARLERRGFWKLPLQDRGYNPPPAWGLFGGSLAKVLDIASPRDQALLVLADPILILAAFGFSVVTFGWWRSLLVLAAASLWVGSHRLMGGKMLQYDWFAACWAALCCVQRGRWAYAGALMAYATSVRVFPGVMMVGPALVAGWGWRKERRLPAFAKPFFGTGAVVLALIVALSAAASGRGWGAWEQFGQSIQTHNRDHKFNQRRVGLPYLSTADLETGFSDKVRRPRREENYQHNAALRLGTQALLGLLLLLAARRRDVRDAMVHSLVLLFALAVSSRYYAAVYALLLLRGALGTNGSRAPPQERSWGLRAMDSAYFTMLAAGYPCLLAREGDRYTYMWANWWLFIYLCAVAGHELWRSVRPEGQGVLQPAQGNAAGASV